LAHVSRLCSKRTGQGESIARRNRAAVAFQNDIVEARAEPRIDQAGFRPMLRGRVKVEGHPVDAFEADGSSQLMTIVASFSTGAA
jgi:hypothetical protein